MKVDQFYVEAKLLEPCLGTCPADPAIYQSFIESKKAKLDKLTGKAAEETTARLTEEELKLLPELTEENKGITAFRRDANGGLILMDFQCRGFLKEAGAAVSGTWGISSKIDQWLFIRERQIPLMRDGKQLTAPDGIFERPLRAQTMQGPRVALASSEIVGSVDGGKTKIEPPVAFSFHLLSLPLGADDKKGKLGFSEILSWLEYGILTGLGQWRSGSFGRFTARATELGKVNYSVDFNTMQPSVTSL